LLLAGVEMIEIFDGIIAKTDSLINVAALVDFIYEEGIVISNPRVTWLHPGSYWMVLE